MTNNILTLGAKNYLNHKKYLKKVFICIFVFQLKLFDILAFLSLTQIEKAYKSNDSGHKLEKQIKLSFGSRVVVFCHLLQKP
jgi:hypothetical protein